MARLIRVVLLSCCLSVPLWARAAACEAHYYPDWGGLIVPCVKIGTSEDVYQGSLGWTGESNFRLGGVWKQEFVDARITDIQVTTDPFPIILAFIALTGGCDRVYDPAPPVIAGDNITIAIKVALPLGTVDCVADARTEVRAFSFGRPGTLRSGTTYTVTINGVARSFLYVSKQPGV